MTMQFRVPESPTLPLKAGQSIASTFTASAEGLTIGAVHAVNPAAGSAPGRPQPDHSMSGMGQHGMQGMGDMKGMKGMKGMMDSCHEMMGGPMSSRSWPGSRPARLGNPRPQRERVCPGAVVPQAG